MRGAEEAPTTEQACLFECTASPCWWWRPLAAAALKHLFCRAHRRLDCTSWRACLSPHSCSRQGLPCIFTVVKPDNTCWSLQAQELTPGVVRRACRGRLHKRENNSPARCSNETEEDSECQSGCNCGLL